MFCFGIFIFKILFLNNALFVSGNRNTDSIFPSKINSENNKKNKVIKGSGSNSFVILNGVRHLVTSSDMQNMGIKSSDIITLKDTEVLSLPLGKSYNKIMNTGRVAAYPISSKNVRAPCSYKGHPICCEGTSDIIEIGRKRFRGFDANGTEPLIFGHKVLPRRKCSIFKEYYSSPYERRHYEKALEIAKISDTFERNKKLVDFITSPEEINDSQRWLDRVRLRMNSGLKVPEVSVDDEEFLSKFLVSRYYFYDFVIFCLFIYIFFF